MQQYSLTGTSNVYTDVSMYIPKQPEKTEEEKAKTENIGNLHLLGND